MRRNLLVAFVFLLSCIGIKVQAQDFKVENFRENLTDLSAAISGVQDRNKKDAALIRFAVRDENFELEPNLGILKEESATGEIRIYVPEDTKRITIRHPKLGVLRDYTIPIPIKSKTTYDAEIVITNPDYLLVIFGSGNVTTPSVKDVEVTELPKVEVPKAEPVTAQEQTKSQESVLIIQKDKTEPLGIHFYAGLGLNALSVMGPSVNLGVRYKIFAVEAGFAYGLDKVENIKFSLRSSSILSETYDYSCNKAWLRLGANFDTGQFRITPQAGVAFNMISGKASDGANNTSDYFKDSNPMSVSAAVRLSYEVADHLFVHLTPQFDFAIGGDQVFDVIKEADSKIKNWGEGFGVNVGLIYEF